MLETNLWMRAPWDLRSLGRLGIINQPVQIC